MIGDDLSSTGIAQMYQREQEKLALDVDEDAPVETRTGTTSGDPEDIATG